MEYVCAFVNLLYVYSHRHIALETIFFAWSNILHSSYFFFLCPQSKFRNLKEAILQLHIGNFFKKYFSATAYPQFCDHNFFHQSASSNLQLVKEMLIRNCISGIRTLKTELPLPQLSARFGFESVGI